MPSIYEKWMAFVYTINFAAFDIFTMKNGSIKEIKELQFCKQKMRKNNFERSIFLIFNFSKL